MDKLRTVQGTSSPVGADTHTGCLVLFQQGAVDAITGDDTVLAGLAAQDPYAEVVAGAGASPPSRTGSASTRPTWTSSRFVNGVLERDARADGPWQRPTTPGSPTPWARRRRRPSPVYGRTPVISGRPTAAPRHPPAPGRLGAAARADARPCATSTRSARWRDAAQGRARRARRRRRSARRRGRRYTGDMLLSMALWKAVADRHDLLVATWDSGRVGADRARAALHPDLGPARRRTRQRRPGVPQLRRPSPCRCPRPAGCPTRWPRRCAPGSALDAVRGRRRRPGCVRCARQSSGSATWSTASPPSHARGRVAAARQARPADRRRDRDRADAGADVGGLSARSRTTPPAPSAT